MRGTARGSVAGLLLACTVSGCASGGATTGGPDEYGAISPESAATQFLEAVRRNDYRSMGHLFGTPEGPAERSLGRVEVEQRMFVLASILQHRSFSIRPNPLSGEEGRVQLLAEMVGTRNGDVSVPIITVPYRGRWFVERIQTDPLTRGGR